MKVYDTTRLIRKAIISVLQKDRGRNDETPTENRVGFSPILKRLCKRSCGILSHLSRRRPLPSAMTSRGSNIVRHARQMHTASLSPSKELLSAMSTHAKARLALRFFPRSYVSRALTSPITHSCIAINFACYADIYKFITRRPIISTLSLSSRMSGDACHFEIYRITISINLESTQNSRK